MEPTARMGGDGARMLDAAVSPDSRLLVATSADGTGRLWDLAARRPVGSVLSGGAEDPLAAGRTCVIRNGSWVRGVSRDER